MTKEDFKKIESYLNNSNGYGKIGLQIAKITGMRAEEICKLKYKDIQMGENTARVRVVDGKGKRTREIYVTKINEVNYLKNLISSATDLNTRICAIQSNSLNRAIRRAMKAVEVDKRYTDTTIHSIRKMYAQERYNELREHGQTPIQAWNQVCKCLGHGENRQDLMKVYLSNIF
ncbi:Phage integrase family protein [anaerobic digester metagenome]